MTDHKKVLLVGWDPKVSDYSKWPDLNAEKLSRFLQASESALNADGYDAAWCLLTDADSAVEAVTQVLSQATYDCVMIGGGVRLDPTAFLVFERLISAIHATSPDAKICFNTSMQDIPASVKRWI